MPIYEFFCEACGPFEVWRRVTESGEPSPCPTCRVLATRVYSPPALGGAARAPRDEAGEPGRPRVVARPHGAAPAPPPAARPARRGRPWQLGG